MGLNTKRISNWRDLNSDDWCPECCKEITLSEDWEEACLGAIDKVIHDNPFKP